MARAGLGNEWQCLFANDFDPKKANTYIQNWGSEHLHVGDIRQLDARKLPGKPDLLWASFPCQDLSLAGQGRGLEGKRSSTVNEVWRILDGLIAEGRSPKIIAFENVCGLITSRDGRDFQEILSAFNKRSFRVGAVVLDALDFLPQSRKRVFFIGVSSEVVVPEGLASLNAPETTPANLRRAYLACDDTIQTNWLWWNVSRNKDIGRPTLTNILEADEEVIWDDESRTAKLLSQMSEVNYQKLLTASKKTKVSYGTIFRRTRKENGKRVVRAEVRFDGVAGCLRTPNGGSSKQILIRVEKDSVRTRNLTGRECARLMGLSDDFVIPTNTNEAIHLAGDGVAVPVVEHLSKSIFEPILSSRPVLLRRQEFKRPAFA